MLPPVLPFRRAAGVVFILLAAFESRPLPAAAPETEAGVRLFLAQRYREASSALAAAAGADPSDARAAKYLGRVYFEENDFEARGGLARESRGPGARFLRKRLLARTRSGGTGNPRLNRREAT